MPRDLFADPPEVAPTGPRDLFADSAPPALSLGDAIRAKMRSDIEASRNENISADVNAFANGFGGNVPILGPLASKAADFAGSHIASTITGRPVDQELALGQERGQQALAGHEGANLAGKVVGSVGPLAAMGTTQVGGSLLGITGPLWQRMGFGAASGAILAGGDAAARGDDMTHAGLNSAIGAGIGGGMPLAERVVSPVLQALMGNPPIPSAVKTFNRNLERDHVDPAQMNAQLDALGPDAMPLDLGQNVTREAGAIASLPGKGQTQLRDALVARNLGTNSRIQGNANDILGPAPVPSYVAADIKANQQALSPEYTAALQDAAPVNTHDLALTLDTQAVNERGPAQAVAKSVRRMLDIDGMPGHLDLTPSTLLNTRHAIDGMLSTEADPNTIRVLTQARQAVDATLTDAVPGIKQVDAKYQELARQNTALGNGQNVLKSGPEAPRPAEVADMVSAGVQPEGLLVGPSGAAFRLSQGARAEIDRLVGTTANNLNALKTALKGDGSWNRARLAEVFGAQKADDLLNVLEREQTYARSYNSVTQNSETAARNAAQKEAAPQQFSTPSVGALLTGIPRAALNAAARTRSESVNEQIARMLLTRPTPDLVSQLLLARQADRGMIGSTVAPLLTNR